MPLRGKGFDMDYGTGFVINIMKRKTPKFVLLNNSEMQKERLDLNNRENLEGYLSSKNMYLEMVYQNYKQLSKYIKVQVRKVRQEK
jgi:hypothetical protein